MIYIYDPLRPNRNSYLTTRYFIPMVRAGVAQLLEGEMEDARDKTILVLAEHLNPGNIIHLKNNGNKLVSFDINDNSCLTYTYARTPEVELIDLIFTFSGVQKTQYSNTLAISKDLGYTVKPTPFLDDENWAIYDRMRQSGKLLSLPYHPALSNVEIETPFDSRSPKCLIRGGNHFLRYQLFLNLLKCDLIGEGSEFFANYYGYLFCDDCKEQISKGGLSYQYYLEHKWNCTNEYVHWETVVPDDEFYNIHHAHWNNRCLPMHYWLTENFQKQYGPIDMAVVERTLNGMHRANLREIMGGYLFYGDFKWTHSICIPPRFWEASQSRSINLIPRFTNDQDYLPEVKEFDHYLTFSEDFSDLREVMISVSSEQWEHITRNCFELYDKWIKSDINNLNPNLTNYILEKIENGPTT